MTVLDKTPLLLATTVLLLAVAQAKDDRTEPPTCCVAVNGNDAWSGKLRTPNKRKTDGPFATIERARDEIRKLKKEGRLPRGGWAVELRGGVYELPRTFELTAEDSGAEQAPVVYRAYRKEQVRLVGGREVRGFKPVTDPKVLSRLDESARRKVLQADLKAESITDLPAMQQRGVAMELFFQDRPMTLARWPNEGFVRIVDVPDGSNGDRITYEGDRSGGDRPKRWVAEKDAWLHGYWFHDWSDSRQKIEAIDAGNRVITLGQPRHGYGYKKGQRYYALNLLCELDRPGEWYLDHDTGLLYFWPPGPVAPVDNLRYTTPAPAAQVANLRYTTSGRPTVSLLPSVISLTDTSHVTFRRMTIEVARGTAVTIAGGTGNKIVGCTIRNTGSWGVSVGGRSNGVIGCDIHDTGEGGISLDGGDRKTLTPAANYAENNHIYDYARLERTYRPAVGVNGVGQRVAHNLIHDGPHNGILLGGNDHAVEFNELHSVCYETGDVGAFYTGRRFDWQGNVIRYNYFHDIFGPGHIGALGVYLNDCNPGFTVYGNLFHNVTNAMALCGGRNITVENNLFVDCTPALHVDARGLNWMKYHIEDYMPKMLKEMPYQSPPWSTRYPHLVNILEDEPGAPKYNVIVRNVSFGGRWVDIEPVAKPYLTIKDNLTDQDPQFVDAAHGNFQLKDDSPAYKLGFKRIPIEKMGLYQDETRASWPVVHRVREMPEPIPPTPLRPPGPPPVFKVLAATTVPEIDGTLNEAEWGGLDPTKAMLLEQGIEGGKTAPRSLAWLSHDGASLLVAVDNLVPRTPALRIGRQWGQDDAVEVAVQNTALGKDAPILLLRGFASGHFESSDESKAPAAAVKRAAEGVLYKARVVDAGRWTVEWRIPFASLGVDPKKHTRFAFNLSAFKSAERLWQMWCGTGGNTWWVDKAGVLELLR